jgi:hypothetical protein
MMPKRFTGSSQRLSLFLLDRSSGSANYRGKVGKHEMIGLGSNLYYYGYYSLIIFKCAGTILYISISCPKTALDVASRY